MIKATLTSTDSVVLSPREFRGVFWALTTTSKRAQDLGFDLIRVLGVDFNEIDFTTLSQSVELIVNETQLKLIADALSYAAGPSNRNKLNMQSLDFDNFFNSDASKLASSLRKQAKQLALSNSAPGNLFKLSEIVDPLEELI